MKVLVAAGLLLASGFFSAHASDRNAALRFDGVYYRTLREPVTQHFRFYPDGTVISVATPIEMTPVKIAGWFRRDWPAVAKGRYSVRGRSVQISLKSDIPGEIPDEFRRKVPGTLQYAGSINPAYLGLRRAGEAEEKRYNFVKIRFVK